jgi:cytochrome c oxidase subunit 2
VRKLTGVVAIASAVAFAGCAHAPSTLKAEGSATRTIDGLWWFMFWIASAVFVIVMAILVASLLRRRRRTEIDRSDRRSETFVLVSGAAIPFVILTVLFLYVLHDLRTLSSAAGNTNLTVQVIGHDWWWEVRYPQQGAVTANEIHVPAGERVRVEVTTDDVIHSLWVPQLNAKIDLIPGQTNTTWFEADRPGTYRGQCAEFCGLQHAHMALSVIAQTPADFTTWLDNESQPLAAPTDPVARAGENDFLNSTCVGCHTIRGTVAEGDEGPDLTHVGSRRTIAAGTLTNTRANLERWVSDPQTIKPGAKMPPTELDPDQLQAVLTFLQSLK